MSANKCQRERAMMTEFEGSFDPPRAGDCNSSGDDVACPPLCLGTSYSSDTAHRPHLQWLRTPWDSSRDPAPYDRQHPAARWPSSPTAASPKELPSARNRHAFFLLPTRSSLVPPDRASLRATFSAHHYPPTPLSSSSLSKQHGSSSAWESSAASCNPVSPSLSL